jgi:hypothetical protein
LVFYEDITLLSISRTPCRMRNYEPNRAVHSRAESRAVLILHNPFFIYFTCLRRKKSFRSPVPGPRSGRTRTKPVQLDPICPPSPSIRSLPPEQDSREGQRQRETDVEGLIAREGRFENEYSRQLLLRRSPSVSQTKYKRKQNRLDTRSR